MSETTTLVVGGSGLAGGYTALHLAACGHRVSIMSRHAPTQIPGLRDLPHIQCDYVEDAIKGRIAELVSGFQNLIFCAGNDIKQFPVDVSVSPEAFFDRCNTQAIPRFFEQAQSAGVVRAVYLGTFYPQVAPQQIARDPYVKSRHAADEAVRELSGPSFKVCSINPPFLLGHVPGLSVPYLNRLARYARGELPALPVFAPQGGSNHITLLSIAEALEGGLSRGESGKAYLVGDANLSWKDYLEAWFHRAGNAQELAIRDDDHPIFPHRIMYAGQGVTVSYEPPEEETALLGYRRGRILEEITQALRVYR
ncbi:MAG: NAD(P)-dependent oxidoreductase [Pseudomonadota bacterium]